MSGGLPTQDNQNLITIPQLIKLATEAGVDFGKGAPYNRLRYYIKIGLLPHPKKKSLNGRSPVSVYPQSILQKLLEIDRNQKSKTIQEITRDHHKNTNPWNIAGPRVEQDRKDQETSESQKEDTVVYSNEPQNSPTSNKPGLFFKYAGLSFLFLFAFISTFQALSFINPTDTSKGIFVYQRGSETQGNVLGITTSKDWPVVKFIKAVLRPIGQLNVALDRLALPESTNKIDPLALTYIDEVFKLDSSDRLVSAKPIKAESFTGSGKYLTDLPWSEISDSPTIISSVNDVSPKNGSLQLLEGSNIHLSSNIDDGTITISSTSTSTVTSGSSISLKAGSGISIAGSSTKTITNTDLGSSQSIFKNIAVPSQTTLSAGTNNDTLTFAAGSGIAIATDSGSKTVTITNTGGGSSNADTLDTLDSTDFLRSTASSSLSSGNTLTIAAGATLSIAGSLSCTNCIGDSAVSDTLTASNLVSGSSVVSDSEVDNNLTIDSSGSLSATAINSGTLGNGSVTLALGSFGSITGTLADGNVSDTLTIGSGGSVDWAALNNFPSSCSANNAVTAVGSTLTCSAFWNSSNDGSGSGLDADLLDGLSSAAFQAAGTYVTSVSGTTNRISSTGGTTPVIDIDAAYVGQGSITTVGALDAGSITGNFGAINVGSDNITTTGTVNTGSLILTGNISDSDSEVSINDDLDVVGQIALGSDGAIGTDYTLYSADTSTVTSGTKSAIRGLLTANPGSNSSADFYGEASRATTSGYANINITGSLTGGSFTAIHQGTGTSTLSTARGVIVQVGNTGDGTITNSYGVYTSNPNNSGGGTITTNYGIFVEDQTAGSSDYGITIAGADTQALWIGSGADNTDSANGIAFGSSRDTNLYRSAANYLATDDDFSLGGGDILGANSTGIDIGELVAGDFTFVNAGAANSDYLVLRPNATNSATFKGIITSADITVSDKTWTFPNENGTVCTTGSVCSGYQASGSYVTSVSGTSNRISSTGGTTPVIDIDAAYVGQASITTVGALNSGSITSGFDAIDVGADNITTTGSIYGNDFDRTTSGTLTFGNTNASTISLCNSTACDTLNIGTNSDADAINIGDANDTLTVLGSVAAGNTGFAITLANAGSSSSTGISLTSGTSSTGTINLYSAIVPDSSITSTGTINGFNFAAISTGPAAGTLNALNIGSITTAGAGTESAIKIGSGWDASIRLTASGANSVKNFTIKNDAATPINLFELRDLTGNTTQFGSLALADAFVSKQSYFAEEFNSSQVDCIANSGSNAAETNNLSRGTIATGRTFGTACSTTGASNGTTEISTSKVASTANTGNKCDFQNGAAATNTNGYEVIKATSTNTSGHTISCLEYLGTNSDNTANKLFNSSYLPQVTMKIRSSQFDSNRRFFVGISDRATAAQNMATTDKGAYFTNCTAPTTPTCVSNKLIGVISDGSTSPNSATSTNAVDCGTTDADGNNFSSGQFAYGRIEFRKAPSGTDVEVEFFVDYYVDDGIHEKSCGTITTIGNSGGFSNVGMSMLAMVTAKEIGGFSTNQALDVDYFRVWQDDAPTINEGNSNTNLEADVNLTDNQGLSNSSTQNSTSSGSGFNITKDLKTSDSLNTGDLVSIDSLNSNNIVKSSQENDQNLLGVASRESGTTVPVIINGRAYVKVSSANGPIKPGEPLTSSTIPGVAVKANQSGMIIGRALEAFEGEEEGKIIALIQPDWYISPLDQELTNSSLTQISLPTLKVENLSVDLINLGDVKIAFNNGALEINKDVDVLGVLKAKQVKTDELVVSDKTSGNGTVLSGQNQLVIENELVKDESKILITFNDDYYPATRYWTTKVAGRSFTIRLDQPVSADTKLDWLIIN